MFCVRPSDAHVEEQFVEEEEVPEDVVSQSEQEIVDGLMKIFQKNFLAIQEMPEKIYNYRI